MRVPDLARTSASGPYAVVAVNAGPVRPKHAREYDADDDPEDRPLDAFHYHIPATLSGLQPGHLVWVPFGSQYLQGVVMALADSSPVAETRPIDRLADPDPMLTPLQLELARWISHYYMAPLQQVVWAMIPPGITEQVTVLVEPGPDGTAVEGALEDLTAAQRTLLDAIRERGTLTQDQVGHLTEFKGWRGMLTRLVATGWVARRMVFTPPQVRPKIAEFVRLCGEPPTERTSSAAATRRMSLLALLQRWPEERPDTQGWIMRTLAQEQTGALRADVRTLAEKGCLETTERQVWRDPLAGKAFVPVTPPRLTSDQESIWCNIAADLEAPAGKPFLLQGVTGSGKTEIYLRAAQRVLAQGRSVIVLVPEIALTPQTIRRFGARHPDAIAVLHSQLTPGERYDQWRRIRGGELRLVVGSRSAIFSPVANLGLIVLDEEHEWTYKQEDRSPRYHAREVALQLAEITGATVILGSATPSLESAYRAERGQFVHLSLPNRVMGHRRSVDEQLAQVAHAGSMYHPFSDDDEDALYTDLPPVEVVDLRTELKEGNTGIFSRALQQALTETLDAGQQVILFVDRRGSASFVLCRDCGHVLACAKCGLSLTYHAAESSLICHRCSVREGVPEQCPRCHSPRIRYFGLGTQRVEEAVRKQYPRARVVRWDHDATRGRNSHEDLLERFTSGEADVLVGTQMVAKGLDLPRVTLVGVVSADTLLNLPDLRSGERAFQVLTQVAGRAGRSMLGGRVIIQTYAPEHPAVVMAQQHDYGLFYQHELAFRRAHWYPPLSRIVRLMVTGSQEQPVQQQAEELHALLAQRIARLGLPEVDLIGPAPAFYERLHGRWRWQLLVRGADPCEVLRDMQLPGNWRVDVDPQSML